MENKFSKVMVEINGGVIVNITDLPKEQYEAFLDLMHRLRLSYIAINSIAKSTKTNVS